MFHDSRPKSILLPSVSALEQAVRAMCLVVVELQVAAAVARPVGVVLPVTVGYNIEGIQQSQPVSSCRADLMSSSDGIVLFHGTPIIESRAEFSSSSRIAPRCPTFFK